MRPNQNQGTPVGSAPSVIEPTIGRQVHYFPNKGQPVNVKYAEQPFAATICCVHNDHNVNLQIIDHEGNAYGRNRVRLVQPGEDRPTEGEFCCWMSFQIGQTPAASAMVSRVGAVEEAVKELEESLRLARSAPPVEERAASADEDHSRHKGKKKD